MEGIPYRIECAQVAMVGLVAVVLDDIGCFYLGEGMAGGIMGKDDKKTSTGLTAVDWLLIAAIVVIVAGGILWIMLTPAYWACCIKTLDIRNWTKWTWRGVLAALVAILLIIRFWPEKKRRPTDTR